ncbi:hypothetical protein M0R45_019128 [Rubus argutus]|uniref:DUF676 domain-containing protein n=1 Tax=Rubus argutus TaxID=59490 RepID=A0AAW1X5B6_RUBAR
MASLPWAMQACVAMKEALSRLAYSSLACKRNEPNQTLLSLLNIQAKLELCASDWRYAADQFVKNFLINECNSSRLTFDGVDLMGERLAKEVLAVVSKRSEVRKISFVAHSLGGLVARYAMGCCMNLSQHPNPQIIMGIAQLKGIQIMWHSPLTSLTKLPFLCGLPFLRERSFPSCPLYCGEIREASLPNR